MVHTILFCRRQPILVWHCRQFDSVRRFNQFQNNFLTILIYQENEMVCIWKRILEKFWGIHRNNWEKIIDFYNNIFHVIRFEKEWINFKIYWRNIDYRRVEFNLKSMVRKWWYHLEEKRLPSKYTVNKIE